MAVKVACWRFFLLAAPVLLGGCMSLADYVQTSPLRGQPEGQRLRDARDCGGSGTHPTVSTIQWFSSCMIARGYQAYVAVEMSDPEVHEGYHPLGFLVQADRAQSQSEVQVDLVACQSAVDAVLAAPALATKYVRALMGRFMFGINIHSSRASKTYELCLLDKGYTVALWRAGQ